MTCRIINWYTYALQRLNHTYSLKSPQSPLPDPLYTGAYQLAIDYKCHDMMEYIISHLLLHTSVITQYSLMVARVYYHSTTCSYIAAF